MRSPALGRGDRIAGRTNISVLLRVPAVAWL